MNLRDAINEAKDLGIPIRHINGTGEIQFLFPDGPRETVNMRRKDAPRHLLMRLRQARKKQGASA